MKKMQWIFGLSSLLLLSASWASSPIFTITPSTTQTTVRSDGETSVNYTVLNNATTAVYGLQVDPTYSKTAGQSVKGVTLQHDNCTGSTLPVNAQCTFGIVISGAHQPNQFVVTPAIYGNGGQASSTTDINNILAVNVDQVSSAPYAYFGVRQGPGLGAPITGKVVSVSTTSPYTLSTPVTQLALTGSGFTTGTSIAVSLNGSYVYAAEEPNINNVGVTADIAVLTGGASPALVKRIALPTTSGANFFIALTPDGNTLYVSGKEINAVYAINLQTDVVTTLSASFSEPSGIVVSPDGTRVYIVNQTGGGDSQGSISVFDTSTNQLVTTITNASMGLTVLESPTQINVNPAGSTLFVSNSGVATVVTITISNSTYAFGGVFNMTDTPSGLSVSADGNYLYVASAASSHVYQVNTNSDAITTLSTTYLGSGVALTPDNTSLFVALMANDSPQVFTGLPTTPSSATTISLASAGLSLTNYAAFIN